MLILGSTHRFCLSCRSQLNDVWLYGLLFITCWQMNVKCSKTKSPGVFIWISSVGLRKPSGHIDIGKKEGLEMGVETFQRQLLKFWDRDPDWFKTTISFILDWNYFWCYHQYAIKNSNFCCSEELLVYSLFLKFLLKGFSLWSSFLMLLSFIDLIPDHWI